MHARLLPGLIFREESNGQLRMTKSSKMILAIVLFFFFFFCFFFFFFWTVCWSVGCIDVFTALQHILCNFGRGQLTYPHCSWASLLGSLPVLSDHSFACNWQLPFLNQRKGVNGRRNVFMTKYQRKNVLPGMRIEPATVRIPGGCASDRATAPGLWTGETNLTCLQISQF